jgi:hypothetical protein
MNGVELLSRVSREHPDERFLITVPAEPRAPRA